MANEDEGLTSNTYECIGGPLDGSTIALEPDKKQYSVVQMLQTTLDLPETDPVPIQTGFYKVKRHGKKGYALFWMGWITNS